MTAVLLWKEYRQQRTVWLAIAVLAVVLVALLATTLGHARGWEVFAEGELRMPLDVAVICLMVTYGVVSGALLLAGEREDGTLTLLDIQTGRRSPVWWTKVAAGVLFTLSQGLVLAALAVGLGFGTRETAPLIPLAGLDALGWGLFGGARCRTVLTAVLAGIALMAGSWVLSLLSITPWTLVPVRVGLVLIAYCLSWRWFCADDLVRRRDARRVVTLGGWNPAEQPEPTPRPTVTERPRKRRLAAWRRWRVLWWLAFRQGRWVLAAGLVGAVALGCTVNEAPLVLWPFGTLLLGLACGLATFAPDQKEGRSFLGSRRFPPDRVWGAKLFFWGTAAFGLCALAWYIATTLAPNLTVLRKGGDMSAEVVDALAHPGQPHYWVNRWLKGLSESPDLPIALFLGLWPVYGFCFGQFFALVTRRPVIAVILAVFITPVVLLLYVPSLAIGGVGIWWVLPIPVLLLLTTALAVRPWVSERLWTARPLTGIIAAAGLVAIGVVVFLWHRATAVPDVGEPFDVTAFTVSLPGGGKDEAGPLIRQAVAALKDHQAAVNRQLGPPTRPLFPEKEDPGDGFQPAVDTPFGDQLDHVVKKGWPRQDQEIGRWLDLLFQGAWANDAERAARLPLGLVEDPRLVKSMAVLGRSSDGCYQMARLFVVRALQGQARGHARGSLRDLETALGLSRQLRHDAPALALLPGLRAESLSLEGFRIWLQKTGSDKELLRAALRMLQQHEAANPDPADSIKSQYLVDLALGPYLPRENPKLADLLRLACLVPWEHERQVRTFHAMYVGQLQEIQKPVRERHNPWPADPFLRAAAQSGLPTAEGPASRLDARRWGELVLQCRMTYSYGLWLFDLYSLRNQRLLHAAQLATAAALYQADHRRPLTRADELVPTYLPAVPTDPLTGKAFGFRISAGERILDWPVVRFKIQPGRALVWGEYQGQPYSVVPGEQRLFCFPVPVGAR
jgi:hypothetical protein